MLGRSAGTRQTLINACRVVGSGNEIRRVFSLLTLFAASRGVQSKCQEFRRGRFGDNLHRNDGNEMRG